jgi:thiol-disulfide isomerase/thioredoxin
MGTWCPNCLDESRYLRDQKNKYQDNLEIIAVTFESQETYEEKIEKVKRYKENLDLNYTFVIGGKACKQCAADLFPMLNNVVSFPTLIFIDKTGTIRRIHTGFNGPGTGAYYEKFVEKTNMFIEQLITE